MEAREPSVGGWRRAAGLFFLGAALSVTGVVPLVAVPFVLLALTLGTRGMSTTLLAGVGIVLVFGSVARDGVWYLERGWAIVLGGWFAAVTLYRPSSRFIARALAATAGTFAVAAAVLSLRPDAWARVDFVVRDAIMQGVGAALEGMRVVGGGEPASEGMVSAIMRTAEQQGELFPALLGLSSVAALGAAWWVYVRMTWGSDRGLGPLREFRFNDHLVWLFIAGVAVIVLGLGEVWARVGTNTVVFMGALYAVRGAAVVTFLSGGLSIVGTLFVLIGLLFMGPLVLGGALIIGLGDTWLDVRTHAEAAAGAEDESETRTMKLILRENVEKLGESGDVVDVKPGYARNYLIPQGLAYRASEANLERLEAERTAAEERAKRDYLEARRRASQLEDITVTFAMRAGEEGKLFGSVTNADIAEKLNAGDLDFELDRRLIEIDEPLKQVGDFTVTVRLHAQVEAEVGVTIVAGEE